MYFSKNVEASREDIAGLDGPPLATPGKFIL